MIASVRETRLGLASTNNPPIDLIGLAEFVLLVDVLEFWAGDQGFPAVQKSLLNPGEYRHVLALLGAGQFLRQAGNSVALIEGGMREGVRTADLRVDLPNGGPVRVEVKTPSGLLMPLGELSYDAAKHLMRSQFKSAGSSSRGQLAPDQPGMLVVGGFHLGRSSLSALERAAKTVLNEYTSQRRHIVGIIIVSYGVLVQEGQVVDGGLITQPGSKISPVLDARYTANPNYVGPILVSDARSSQLVERKVEGPITHLRQDLDGVMRVVESPTTDDVLTSGR